MLRDDPEGALAFAEAWDATGGGEGARHCAALAQLTVGEPDQAADQLERLAIGSDTANHAAYLRHWCELLRQDPRVLLQVLGDARRAADLIAPEPATDRGGTA